MSGSQHFFADAQVARARFWAACGALGLAVETVSYSAASAASGQGEIEIDLARLGSPEAPNVLVITPGAKPADARTAAGIQTACLREAIRREVPRDAAMVFIHLADPSSIPAPEMMVQPEPAVAAEDWSDDALAAAERRYTEWLKDKAMYGNPAMPEGVGPAARAAALQGPLSSDPVFARLVGLGLENARRVAVLDIQTGTGASGEGSLTLCRADGKIAAARALFGAAGDAEAGMGLPGPFPRGLAKGLPDTVEVNCAVLEFGTYSVRSVMESMMTRNGGGTPGRPGAGLFYPDTEDWKRDVWSTAEQTIRAILRHIGK